MPWNEPFDFTGYFYCFDKSQEEIKLKRFKLDASCEFQAEDLDDAFMKLSKHFIALASLEDSELIEAGQMSVEPIRENR